MKDARLNFHTLRVVQLALADLLVLILKINVFTARSYAERCLSYSKSVCLSVTRRYCVTIR